LNKTSGQTYEKKVNSDKYLDTEGVYVWPVILLLIGLPFMLTSVLA